MQYKQLATHHINIPAVGMGTMGIGGRFTRDESHDDQMVQSLERGIDAGMTLIDTAEAYGKGHSEELIGLTANGKRQDLFIASKVSPEHLRFKDVIKATERSLKRLRTDYIDLYQVHWPNPTIPISETMEAMVSLVNSGKIRFVGVSNFSLYELKEAMNCCKDIVSVQVEYNLFDRTIEEDILPFCKLHTINLLAYTPLCSGMITHNSTKLPMLEEFAKKYGRTPSQIALRWLTTNNLVTVLPKSVNSEHTQTNAEATDFDLTEEDFQSISRLFKEPCIEIPPHRIMVDRDGLDTFVPSAAELSGLIKDGVPIKPIRVIKSTQPSHDYELVEGKLRYWAWVMAHEGKAPVPALVRK